MTNKSKRGNSSCNYSRSWAFHSVHNLRKPFDRLFALCDPVTQSFDLLALKSSVGYPKVILYSKFEHFRIIHF